MIEEEEKKDAHKTFINYLVNRVEVVFEDVPLSVVISALIICLIGSLNEEDEDGASLLDEEMKGYYVNKIGLLLQRIVIEGRKDDKDEVLN